MADLNDLLNIPISEMTVEQLEEKLIALKKLKLSAVKKPAGKKASAPKSNKDKQLADLINQLTPEQLATLRNKLKGGL